MVEFQCINLGYRPCIICGASYFEHVKTVNSISVLQCKQCGIIFAANISEKDLEDFYETEYFNNPNLDFFGYRDYGGGNQIAETRNYGRLADLIARYRGSSPPGRWLDVGCASGGFVPHMKLQGWDAEGFDPSAYSVSKARVLYGLEIFHGTVDSFEAQQASYDIVSLKGVLEHLVQPLECLRGCCKWLRQGGYLLITTLDVWRFPRLYKIKPPEHIFYFQRRHLLRLLEKSGFEVVNARTYFKSYKASDYFCAVSSVLAPRLVRPFLRFFDQFPKLDVVLPAVPTNEVVVLARKI